MAPKDSYGHISCLNPLNAKLKPICHLLALFGAHHILHVGRKRVNFCITECQSQVILEISKSVCKFGSFLIVSVRGMKEVTSITNNDHMRPTDSIYKISA
jgi:hypothetical protein